MRTISRVGRVSLLLGMFALARAEAATYYVSTQGNDANPGTSAQPFRTITRAYSAASAGTTILVAPGVYTDYTSAWGIHLGTSGTASSPIVLRSQTRGAAVIDRQQAADGNAGFYIDGDYNIVDGFEIRNCLHEGMTIWSTGVQILNCYIHNNTASGIYSSEDTLNCVYSANLIAFNGVSRLDHCMYICGKNDTIINNVLLAAAGTGLQVAGYTTVANMKVYNNVIAYNGHNGIILWQTLNGVDIRNNIFYANGMYSIGCSGAHGGGVTVDHNLSYGNAYGDYQFRDETSDFGYTLGTTIYSDPGLVNQTSGSFDPHLKSGSPAVQAAVNLFSSFTTDMAGATRPPSGSWDLGTYKYGSATPSDTTPPTASITSPASGATVSGSISVTCSASDNVGVTSVQLQCDGANLGAALTAAPYTLALNTTSLANGSHSLRAIALDAAGNQTTTTAVTVNVQNTTAGLPIVSVAATVPTAVLGTTNYGVFTFTRTGSTASALTVNYSLGGTAVKWNDYYRYGVGDMPVSITIPAGAAAYTMSIVARDNQTHANPETVTLNLWSDPAYQVGSPAGATITILSNAPVTVPPMTVTLAKVPTGMKLTWNSVAGKTYRVAYRLNFFTPWADLTGDIVATGASTSYIDTTAGTTPSRLYRVYAVNP